MTLAPGLHPVPKGHLAAVVTYLQMTAPALTTPKPFPTGYGATRERLDAYDYKWLFREIGAPWLWTSRLVMDDDELHANLTSPDVETWIIRQTKTAIGLVELDFREEGACELALFGLVKTAVGQGLGLSMIALAQEQAFSRQIDRFHVHTCSLDSPEALGFYQRAGFVAYDRGVEVVADPRLHGVLSASDAPDVPCLN